MPTATPLSPAQPKASTARAARRQAAHDFRRNRILDAARRRIARDGAHGFSLRAVAREAGYTPAALYAYFASRDALLMALASDGLAELARVLRAADDETAAPEVRLAALLNAFLAAARAIPDEPALIAALTSAAGRDGEPQLARQVTGRVIAALAALGRPLSGRNPTGPNRRALSQRDQEATLRLAATAIGLAVLERGGFIDGLGFGLSGLIAQAVEEALAEAN